MTLAYPFSFAERRVHVENQVLFVPPHLDDHQTFGVEWEQLFEQEQPLVVEYCCGNGHWVNERAEAEPGRNWIGLDKRFDRIRKTWAKWHKLQLKNLFMVCGEGMTVTEHYFLDESVSEVYINFPDPWPRRRHAKHRLLTEPFAQQLERILVPGGRVVLATDDPETVMRMEEIMHRFHAVEVEPVGYGNSTFEKLWRRMGKEIRFIGYRRH